MADLGKSWGLINPWNIHETLMKIILCSAEPTMFKLSPNLTTGLKVKVINPTVVDINELLFPKKFFSNHYVIDRRYPFSHKWWCIYIAFQIIAVKVRFDFCTFRSERVGKTNVGGTLLTEAKYINLSLHYLEQVRCLLHKPAFLHLLQMI